MKLTADTKQKGALAAGSFLAGIAATVIAGQILASLQSGREGKTALLAAYATLGKPVAICRQWDAVVDTVQPTGTATRDFSQLAARVRLVADLPDSMTDLSVAASSLARYDMRLARTFYDAYATLLLAFGRDAFQPHSFSVRGDSQIVVYGIHNRRVAFTTPLRQRAAVGAAADTILRGSAGAEFCDQVRSLQIELGTRLGLQ